MESLYNIIRIIHLFAAGLWIGEIVIINFVLFPALENSENKVKKSFLIALFKKLFKMASISSIAVSLTGIIMLHNFVKDIDILFTGRWGLSILIGGSLALLLTIFHFFVEGRLSKKLKLQKKNDEINSVDFHLKRKIIPRVALVIIVTIFLLMVNATRGIL